MRAWVTRDRYIVGLGLLPFGPVTGSILDGMLNQFQIQSYRESCISFEKYKIKIKYY